MNLRVAPVQTFGHRLVVCVWDGGGGGECVWGVCVCVCVCVCECVWGGGVECGGEGGRDGDEMSMRDW